MEKHLDSVKTQSAERGYHHGALREALLKAAEELIAERGVDHFSLREVARRAGVSPSAPAHHFRDARGLLTALATIAFQSFGDAIEASDRGKDRMARIRSQGRAYVRFAITERAKFDLMWRYALIDREDPNYAMASQRAFNLLDEAVRGKGTVRNGPTEPALAPSIACWAMVHGFARLALDGAFGTDETAPARAAEALLPRVLDHLSV